MKDKKEEMVEIEGLPKANLSETADPLIFLDRMRGELYIIVKNYFGRSYLKKLNEGGQ